MVHLHFVVPGPPVSHQTKDRKNLGAWKATVKAEAAKTWKGAPLTGKLKFTLINFHEGDDPPMDDDNMVKPIRDALNKFVFEDDSQIRHSEMIHFPIDAPLMIRGGAAIILEAFNKAGEFLYVRIEDASAAIQLPRGRQRGVRLLWVGGIIMALPAHGMDNLFTSANMEELDKIAQQYRNEGYSVLIHPDNIHLPEFARGFDMDLLATRDEGGVLVQVKRDRAELFADLTVPRQAEITNAQPGWRYDLILLGQHNVNWRKAGMPQEPTREQIQEMIAEAERVLGDGSPRASFLLAWAGLEAAMRKYAQRSGLNAKIGTQATVLIRQIYGVGGISPDDFQQLEAARLLRTEVVHGLAHSAIESAMVQGVIDTGRRLLVDSDALQPMAG